MEHITFSIPLFSGEKPPHAREMQPDISSKPRILAPRDYTKYIERWMQINTLFLNHYPFPEDAICRLTIDSKFSETRVAQKLRTLSTSPVDWNDETQQEQKEMMEEVRYIRKTAPHGYCQFLQVLEESPIDNLSSVLDDLVTRYPDFWNRVVLRCWSEGSETYDKIITFLDALSTLDIIWKRPVEKIYEKLGKAQAKKGLKIQCENTPVFIDVFWKDVIIDGIFNEANKWLEKVGIDIDVWGLINSSEFFAAKGDGRLAQKEDKAATAYLEAAKQKVRDFKKEKVEMDGEKPQHFVAGSLVRILDWSGATEGNPTMDSAEFIMRFLVICGLESEEAIAELDKIAMGLRKDDSKNLKSQYSNQRKEIYDLIRKYNNYYKRHRLKDNQEE